MEEVARPEWANGSHMEGGLIALVSEETAVGARGKEDVNL